MEQLARRYIRSTSLAERDRLANQLLVENSNFIKDLVAKVVIPKEVSALVDRDELIQVGMLKLLQVLRRYDPDRGQLSTIAYRRVFGALRDYIRKVSPDSRTRRVKVEYGSDITLEQTMLAISTEDEYESTLPPRLSPVLESALMKLPLKQALSLLLSIHGLEIVAISSIMETPQHEVIEQRVAALKMLRAMLAGMDVNQLHPNGEER